MLQCVKKVRVILSVLQSAANLPIFMLAGGKHTIRVEESTHHKEWKMFDSDYMLPFFSAKIPPRGYALVGMTDFFGSLMQQSGGLLLAVG